MNSKRKEIETEEHTKTVAEREYGRIEQENQRLVQELAKLKEKRNIHEV